MTDPAAPSGAVPPIGVSLLFVGRSILPGPDTPDALAILTTRLHSFHVVDDGLEGFMAFAKYRPDILFTDIAAARMDAVALARAARHIRPDAQVIFAVDFADTVSLRQAMSVSQASFAPKPLSVESILSAVADVAEVIAARRELEEQRHLSEMTLKSLPQPAMLIDRADRKIILANASAQDLGFTQGVVCEGPLFASRAFARPEQARSFDDYVTYYASIETREVPFAERTWDVVLTQVAGGRVLFTAYDVTDRKAAEDKLREAHAHLEQRVLERTAELNQTNTMLRREIGYRKKAEELLKAGQEQYRALADNSPDMIARFDRDLRFLYVNPALAGAAGVPPERYLGRSEFDADVPARLREALRPQIREVFATASPAQIQFAFDCRPNVCFFDWRVIPEPGAGGGVETVLAIARDITELKRVEDKLRELATTDALTGVANRRHFLETAEHELLRSIRYDLPLAMLMLDADHFKSVNDNHGHDIGDIVLKKLAVACHATLREIDLFGRLGGEEFGVLLPETDRDEARIVAERLLAAIRALRVPVPGGELAFTVSAGLATRDPSDSRVDDILKRADDALYRAKQNGRDRVETA